MQSSETLSSGAQPTDENKKIVQVTFTIEGKEHIIIQVIDTNEVDYRWKGYETSNIHFNLLEASKKQYHTYSELSDSYFKYLVAVIRRQALDELVKDSKINLDFTNKFTTEELNKMIEEVKEGFVKTHYRTIWARDDIVELEHYITKHNLQFVKESEME